MDAAAGRADLCVSTDDAPRCRHCGTPLRYSLIDLGMSPLCESFLTKDQLGDPESYYPLHVRVCDSCWLAQLPQFVSPDHIFSEYAYFSSFSTSWVAHAGRYCDMIKGRLGLGPDSFVVELGSNDGYLLRHFLNLGGQVLGVEPAANVAQSARDAGVPTLVAFFDPEVAKEIVADRGHADLIIANNVLAQVPELNDFVTGMARLLAPAGVITIEVPHLERLVAENQFDTIYHEHFSYFSLCTISRLAVAHRLKVIDVEKLPSHGGSLRVYLAHQGSQHPISMRVGNVLAEERYAGLESVAAYSVFTARVQHLKRDLLAVLIKAKEQGKRICGYGAPGKGNTLLNYAGIGPDFLDFTVDRNPYKHGRYTPGMHIPIYPVEAIDKAKPDYILILPWNLKQEIVQQMRHVAKWGAKFIVPIPELSIIDPQKS
jgi:SAM-dependent methyltransferase